MINRKINLIKILLILIIFTHEISYSELLFGQENKGLIFEIKPNEINGDNFDGKLLISIENASNYTIYITMEPFYCHYKKDTLKLHFVGKYGYYLPNNLFFVKQNSELDFLDYKSNISFLKFPPILYLNPRKKVNINIIINNKYLNLLNGSKWDIFLETGYSFKSDVDTALKSKPNFLSIEFEKSLYFRDTINIELNLNEKSESDSLLYLVKDGMLYDYSFESIYDSIIFKCFIQRVYIE